MRRRRHVPPSLDLDELPADVRKVITAAIEGAEVAVARGTREVGTLTFRSSVLEGVVLPVSRLPPPQTATPDGVTVVATVMRLSDAVRQHLSDELGTDYIVFDMLDAPASTDVVLTHPISTQLLGLIRGRFPRARVIVTEIEDDELGVSYSGPVSRLLAAGAAAYLPPRPVSVVASHVHAYLTQGTTPRIEPAASASPEIPRSRLVDDPPPDD